MDLLNNNKLKLLLGKPVFWQIFVLVFFGALYLTTGITNHYFYRTHTYDYGVYNYAFWDYSHFQINPCPIYSDTDSKINFLQDHFSLTLFFLIPFYWLLNWLTGTYTLIILQVAAIILSGLALSKYITQKSGNTWLGIFACVYYFLMQARFASFNADCNIAIFSACLIPTFLYYFEIKKYTLSLIIFIIALVSREDMALWFIFIFFTLIIIHKRESERIKFCSLLIGAAILYFIILFSAIIPALEAPNKSYSLFTYSALGKTPWEALQYIVTNPIETCMLFFKNQTSDPRFDGVKTEFYITYLISGGFILLFRPQYIIWFIPILAQKMLNDTPVRWSINWYYAVPIATMLPISAFLIISKLKKDYFKYGTAIGLCLLAWLATDRSFNRDNRKMPFTEPLKENMFDAHFFDSKLNIPTIHKSLELIPSDAKVSASNFYLPHLSQRRFIFLYPIVNDAEYIVVNQKWENYYAEEKTYMQSIQNYLHDPNWIIITNEYPFLLLKRK